MKANKTHTYELTVAEKLLYALLFSLAYLFSLLPFWLLYLLSDLCYLVAYHAIGYRKPIVRRNLMQSFPEKSPQDIIRIERDFYHWLCDYAFETIKLLSISPSAMRRRMQFRGMELIEEAARQHRSCSVYIGHYCNWEWVTSLGLWLSPNVLGTQIYHVLENRVFDKLFLHIRSRWHTVSIPMAETLRRVAQYHRDGQSIAMGYISDQVPFWNNIHYWTNFLNHDTPVLTGAEKIAKRFNDRILYFDISRPRRGYYIVQVVQLAEQSKDLPDFEVTETYFRALEQTIQRQPAYWLWTHNRWKRTREEYNRLASTGIFNMKPLNEPK